MAAKRKTSKSSPTDVHYFEVFRKTVLKRGKLTHTDEYKFLCGATSGDGSNDTEDVSCRLCMATETFARLIYAEPED